MPRLHCIALILLLLPVSCSRSTTPAPPGEFEVYGVVRFATIDQAKRHFGGLLLHLGLDGDTSGSADLLLRSLVGVATWDGVDGSRGLSIYWVSLGDRLARSSIAVVSPDGRTPLLLKPGRIDLRLGERLAIDASGNEDRLKALAQVLEKESAQLPKGSDSPVYACLASSRTRCDGLFSIFSTPSNSSRTPLLQTGSTYHYRCAEPGTDGVAWRPAKQNPTGGCLEAGQDPAADVNRAASFDASYFRTIAPDSPERDRNPSTSLIMEAIDARAGMSIADVGAGAGYFTFKLARLVGASGRIYATDVESTSVRYIRDESVRRGFTNVDVIHVPAERLGLPAQSVNEVVLVEVLYFPVCLPDYSTNLYKLIQMLQSLRPGGRLVLSQNALRFPGDDFRSCGRQDSSPEDIMEWATALGYSVQKNTVLRNGEHGRDKWGDGYVLVLSKPGTTVGLWDGSGLVPPPPQRDTHQPGVSDDQGRSPGRVTAPGTP
jgi:precorrin-6B methylase 2